MSITVPTILSFPYMDANNDFLSEPANIIAGEYLFMNGGPFQGQWVNNVFYAQISSSTSTWNVFMAQFNEDNTMTSKYFIFNTLPTESEVPAFVNSNISEVEQNVASNTNWSGKFSYVNDITYTELSYKQTDFSSIEVPNGTYFTVDSNAMYDDISSVNNYGILTSNETFTNNFGIQFQVNELIPKSGDSSTYGASIGTNSFWVNLSAQSSSNTTTISTGGIIQTAGGSIVNNNFPNYNFTFQDDTSPTVTILLVGTYACLIINNVTKIVVDTSSISNYTSVPQYFEWYDTGVFAPMTITNVQGFILNPEITQTPTYNPIIYNICFPAGTPVLTNKGNIPIEQLKPGVHTIYKKPIIDITQTITRDNYLVCFEKNALGGVPFEKTIMSKDHRILYRGKMVPAKNFTNLKKVKKIRYTGEILYNVLLDNYDVMNINGIICETLHPENDVAKLYRFRSQRVKKGLNS